MFNAKTGLDIDRKSIKRKTTLKPRTTIKLGRGELCTSFLNKTKIKYLLSVLIKKKH